MSRVILFRAKGTETGEWRYGYLTPLPNMDPEYRPLHIFDDTTQDWYEIDPSAVCQYTGLTDKEGKPIFEGDYFRVDEKGEFVQKEYNGYVKYGQHNTFHATKESEDFNVGFYVDWDDCGYRSDLAFWAERYSVAGNIFDKNP